VAATGQLNDRQQARGGEPPASRPQEACGQSSNRHFRNLLARCSTRPTAAVEARRQSNRKTDAEQVVNGYQVFVASTRLSTQVYTPISRVAGGPDFFGFFLKSEALDSARSDL
jgi:hypothetical protein